ncbi:putative dolichyl-phosphate-mannose--protein mannosyltransferase [Corynebacterium freiburgense]|nr:phospholipid carrier-dependent glycosyltransferase [Corynebacterium freiburgense]WJZ02113.1 putative dolichyl-phosphate-mannose--protein mannosyltransferase [Corynebacterium freiburgense]
MIDSQQRTRRARSAPRTRRKRKQAYNELLASLIVGVLAFATRFIGLGQATSSNTPVFDEKHYVPQAWDMVVTATDPITGGIESNPGFGLVVHPPLAKQLIAIGEFIFGYTPLGWRVMTALFGTLTVLLIMGLAKRLTHSSTIGLLAGIIATCDGVLLVSSRFGMLDIFQVFFIVAATYCLVRDHQQMKHHIEAWQPHTPTEKFKFGWRWWRFAMGISLGCALSVKWSGLYYMAFFGVLCVALDWMLRRQHQRKGLANTLTFDAFPAFASIVLLPIALYIWSWRAWFASETGVYRHAASDGTIPEDSPLMLLPEALAGWIHYHQSVLTFHASLTTSSGNNHPWESKPWSWLVASRPVLYLSATDTPCGDTECRTAIYLFGTPAIWWLTVPLLCWATWRFFIHRERLMSIPIIAFLAGFVPWVLAYDRQMYFFYAVALAPFTIVLLAWALGLAARSGPKGKWAAAAYAALIVGQFIYFSPILYGFQIPNAWYDQLMWLPSWR